MQRSQSVNSINETDSESQTIAEFYAAKPLPPLPRGWSRVCQETTLFLRSIGLGIVVTAFQGYFTKNFREPEKVAIRRSRVTALLRTLIHAVPLGIAIFEITLNFKTKYAEREFDKQNYIQFAAKAHEIAMQASLATILLSYLRLKIGAGKRMPFGAVLGGLEFLQISYLWSWELWSSIFSKEFQRKKKLCFVSLVFVCITIAATAGPFSANLLRARQGLWSTRSKYLALNATFQDIWPDQLNGEKIDKDCAMIQFDSQPNVARCPLSEMYVNLDKDVYKSMVDFDVTEQLNMDVQSPGSNYDKSLLMSPCLTFENQMCATIPQTGLLDGFVHGAYYQATRSDLFSESHRSDAYQILQKNYYQPYTTASCVLDVVKDGSDETPLRFPRISRTNSDLKGDREIVTIPGLTKAQIINDGLGDNSSFRARWIDLPQNIFNTGIPGAVIINSQGPNRPPYNIYQCTSDAGWGSSAIINDFVQYGSIVSHRMNDPRKDSDMGASDPYGYVYSSVPDFTNISILPFPERRISVSENWMNFINPTLVLADNSTTTFISRYLSSARLQLEEGHVARMLTVFLAIALSNTNLDVGWMVFNDSHTPYALCDTCLVFEIENSLYGWSYTASETTTKLAITVMLAYCALVLGHIIYSTISGVSRTAWGSTAELVALAMNSSPTEIRKNACAGIIGSKALKTPVRVLTTTQGHLELVFGEVKDPNVLVMNEKYGKLACEDDNQGDKLKSTGPGELQKVAVD